MRRVLIAAIAVTVPLALLVAACGSDDGADVRAVGTDASASGSASGSGSGSGSGTGISLDDTQTVETDDAAVTAAVAEYKAYVTEQTADIVAKTTVFTDAVREGRVAAAKAAYAPSREPWERIEPIAGLIEATDGAVDSRVDDFTGPGDPEFTGWHRLEYILWTTDGTAGAVRFANRLDRDLATLQTNLDDLEIPPAAMALGASELIQEVSEGKITGEEDRYSKTDLWDFAANVEGAEKIIELLTPALEAADPELLTRIDEGFTELDASLDELREGDGFVLFCQENDEFPSPDLCPQTTVTQAQIDTLKGQLAGLSEDLALVPGTLGLQ